MNYNNDDNDETITDDSSLRSLHLNSEEDEAAAEVQITNHGEIPFFLCPWQFDHFRE
jgi:hypothetical protein